jgi:membrane-bound lytic murein transglycosylase D
MTQTTRRIFRHAGFFCCILLTSLASINNKAIGQRTAGDTANILYASLNSTEPYTVIIKPSNVVFPLILKGQEEATVNYMQQFSERRKEYLIRMYKKGKVLLPKAAGILKKYNLPQELKVLLTLESAYNAKAVSKAGAVGYWQIMDAVAKEYGMKYVPQDEPQQNKAAAKNKGRQLAKANKPTTVTSKATIVDDRMHFIKSTTVAARYLKDRRRNLNDDWLLVVASYNCGVGNVWEAMQKSGKTNPTFWDIKKSLPAETQAYVMNFITLNVIFANYDLFVKNKLQWKDEKVLLPAHKQHTTADDYNSEVSRLR